MATQLFRNTAEGYSSSGTGVTQGSGGNSGGGSGDYWDVVNLGSSTIQAVTGAKMFGTYGYRLTRTGSTQQHLQKTLAADQSDFVGQHWQKIPTQPSANHVFFKGYSDASATTTSWAVAISTTGKLILLAGSSSTTVFTGTDTLPANTYLRFEYEIVSGTSMRCVVYSLGSNTIVSDSGIVSTALPGVTRTFRIGELTTASSPASMDIDYVTLGSGPGMFGLATSARPSSTVTNPDGFTATGAGTLHAALSDTEAGGELSPSSWAESPAGPTNDTFTVGFEASILPTGGLTIDRWDSQDVASPVISSTLEILVDGVVVGTNTINLTTTVTKTTFTIASVTGDLTTLQGRYTDNQ